MTLIIGTNSWVTINEADSYFESRLGASLHWNSATEKETALITAYNQLKNNSEYSFPISIEQITDNMKKAQCEQALFLIEFNSGIERRKSLQAQGVISSGVIGEQFDKDTLNKLPISSYAKIFLKLYITPGGFYGAKLSRNEEDDRVQ